MKQKLLFIVANDRYFRTHRLDLGLFLQESGYDVHVASPAQTDYQTIIDHGLTFHPITLHRSRMNPFAELYSVFQMMRCIRRIKPDVVYTVGLKPALYGALGARLLGMRKIINAISGLGYLYANTEASFLRRMFSYVFQMVMRGKQCVFVTQNPEDQQEIERLVAPLPVFLSYGAGVDCIRFTPQPKPESTSPLIVTHASRMLWNKGVKEAVEAVQSLFGAGVSICLHIVGEPDPENPASIPLEQLEAWGRLPFVRYLGFQQDMASIYQNTDIALMASYYREGIPKTLIEAASCGLPIITTDTPGCRIIVQDQINGILVPPRQVEAITDALKQLTFYEKRMRMGNASREHALALFDQKKIYQDLFERVIKSNGACRRSI